MSSTILCRADDFGSARAANKAILEAVDSQYIVRNVSCMAAANYIDEGAYFLKNHKNISIGVHTMITSEWDGVRWGPLAAEMEKSDHISSDGCFYHTQEELADKHPDIDAIIKEFDSQLDKLNRLGLHVVYADCHMAPELWIENLAEAFQEWTVKKGLINAEHYYERKIPFPMLPAENDKENLQCIENWLKRLQENEQYFYVVHPAIACEETLQFCNSRFEPGIISRERDSEYRVVTSEKWKEWKKEFDILPIRYTEARKEKNGREALKELVGYKSK